MTDSNHQQDLAAQIKSYHKAGEFDKALAISARAVDSNPRELAIQSFRFTSHKRSVVDLAG